MNKKIVVGIGEILWDMLPAGKQLGGAPANFACFAGKLGADAYVVSKVGNDALGREIIQKLREMGLSREYLTVDKSHPTGVVNVKLDGRGKPGYEIKRQVAWDFIRLSPKLIALAKRTDAVCFGTLAQRSDASRRAIMQFIERLPDAALKIFDVNLRQSFYNRETIDRLLKLANVLKINDEELLIVSRMFALSGGEKEQIKELRGRYKLRAVAVTKGARGAVLYAGQAGYAAESKKIRVVDTVGAGDAFTAALAVGMLKHLHPGRIVKAAAALAEYVCGRRGATPALSHELIRRLGI